MSRVKQGILEQVRPVKVVCETVMRVPRLREEACSGPERVILLREDPSSSLFDTAFYMHDPTLRD